MDRIVLLFVGLFFVFQAEARKPLPKNEAAKIINHFNFDVSYTKISKDPSGSSWRRCWVEKHKYEVASNSLDQNLILEQRMTIPNRKSLGSKKVPVVIMLPPVGGINPLDKNLSTSFCEDNIAAIIIANDFGNIQTQADGPLLPPEDHQMTFYRLMAGIRTTLENIAADPNLDIERVGIFGTSLGGILSSFAMANLPEIAAGFFVVAGGDIPEILTVSQQEEISKIRRKRMKEEGMQTLDEYEVFMREHVTVDPIDLALTMIPETLSMAIAKADDTVPSANQEDLHFAFGEPNSIYFNGGHTGTIGKVFLFHQNKILSFFEKRFKKPNPRPAYFDFMEQFSLGLYY